MSDTIKIKSIKIRQSELCDYEPFMEWLRLRHGCVVSYIYGGDDDLVNGVENSEFVEKELTIFLGHVDEEKVFPLLIVDDETPTINDNPVKRDCFECDNFSYCSFRTAITRVDNDHCNMYSTENHVVGLIKPMLEIIATNCKFFRKLKIINE